MHIKQNRKCVACRETKQQNEMLRIARTKNEYLIDENHKFGGRGAYICRNQNCLKLTIKKKLLNKSFKSNVNNEIYEKLEEYEQNN